MNKLGSETSKTKNLLNFFVLLISLYGVSKKDLVVEETSFFDDLLVDTLAPLQRSVVYVRDSVSSFFNHYIFIVNASFENDQLKKKVQELENTIFQLEELRRENMRLKNLLQFGSDITYKKILAQIVGWDSSGHFRVLRINKGSVDGIKYRSTVVTNGGLVGYIYRVTDHFAEILTILDQSNRVDVIVARTRSHGIVEGFSGYHLIMKYVNRTEPVGLGDKVITAGLGNIYPKGLNVGKITKIERESYGISQFIEVTPSVDFRKLEEVIVLIPPKHEEQFPEIKLDQEPTE